MSVWPRNLGWWTTAVDLTMSAKPANIGDADMLALSAEDSARQFSQRSSSYGDPLDDSAWDAEETTTPTIRGASADVLRVSNSTLVTPTCRGTQANAGITTMWGENLQNFDALDYAILPSSSTVAHSVPRPAGFDTTSQQQDPPSAARYTAVHMSLPPASSVVVNPSRVPYTSPALTSSAPATGRQLPMPVTSTSVCPPVTMPGHTEGWTGERHLFTDAIPEGSS